MTSSVIQMISAGILGYLALAVLVGPVLRLDVRFIRAEARRNARMVAAFLAAPIDQWDVEPARLEEVKQAADGLFESGVRMLKQAETLEKRWQTRSVWGTLVASVILLPMLLPALLHMVVARVYEWRAERELRNQG